MGVIEGRRREMERQNKRWRVQSRREKIERHGEWKEQGRVGEREGTTLELGVYELTEFDLSVHPEEDVVTFDVTMNHLVSMEEL